MNYERHNIPINYKEYSYVLKKYSKRMVDDIAKDLNTDKKRVKRIAGILKKQGYTMTPKRPSYQSQRAYALSKLREKFWDKYGNRIDQPKTI